MSIRVRCPRCLQTAELPDEALGKQGVCNSCGAMVTIPAKLTKICSICGEDVTHARHGKDRKGNYICQKCWDARNSDSNEEISVDTGECSLCHTKIPPGEAMEHDGNPVCKSCFEVLSAGPVPLPPPTVIDKPAEPPPMAKQEMPQPVPPEATSPPPPAPQLSSKTPLESSHEQPHEPSHEPATQLAAALESRPHWRAARRRTSPTMALLATLALAIAVGAIVWAFQSQRRVSDLQDQVDKSAKTIGDLEQRVKAAESAAASAIAAARPTRTDDWEEQHKLQVLLTRNQAALLAALGKSDAALAEYQRLFRMVNGKPAGDALRQEIESAKLEFAALTRQRNESVAVRPPDKNPDPTPTTVAARPPDRDPRVGHTNSTTTPSISPIELTPIVHLDPLPDNGAPTTRAVEIAPITRPVVPVNPDPNAPRPPVKSIFDE